MMLILLNYGYVGETALVFSTPTQIIVASIDSASTTLATTPEIVANNAPVRVYLDLLIFTTIKYTLMV